MNRNILGAQALIGILAVFTAGCASIPVTDRKMSYLVDDSVALAQAHLDRGETIEAYQLAEAGAALDASNPKIIEILEAIQSDQPALLIPSALGVNRYKRISTQPGLVKRIIFYLPDRILDLLDIVGLDLHLGPGIYLNYHITRAVQVGGGARAVAGLGWHTKRSLGLLGKAEAGLSFIAAGAQSYNAGQIGTSGVQAGSFNQAGLHKPTDPVYQKMRDYWAVGADVTLLFLGVSWDLHPVEIIDFLGGFVLHDFLKDDLSSTQGLHLNKKDKRSIEEIIKVLRESPEAVKRYQEKQRYKNSE